MRVFLWSHRSVSAADVLAAAGSSSNTADSKKPLPIVPGAKKPPTPLVTRISEVDPASRDGNGSVAPPPPSKADDDPNEIKPATAESAANADGAAGGGGGGGGEDDKRQALGTNAFASPTDDEIKSVVDADVARQLEDDQRDDAVRLKELRDQKNKLAKKAANAGTAAPAQTQAAADAAAAAAAVAASTDAGADSEPEVENADDEPAPPPMPLSDEENDPPPPSADAEGGPQYKATVVPEVSSVSASTAAANRAAAEAEKKSAEKKAAEAQHKHHESLEFGLAKKLLISDEKDHNKNLRINAFKHEKLDADSILNDWKAFFRLEQAQLDYLRKDLEDIFESSNADAVRVRQEIELMDRDLNNSEYFLLKKIGGGGFGAVYKGLKRDTNSIVAIKIIDLEEAADDIQTITREIATLAQGKHCPQLVNYYGSTVKSTKLWIAMEFVDGGAVLDAVKERKTLEEKYIAIVAREVLIGLAYLATNGKIHRDIKAANILLGKNGCVKLADFGASRQLTDTVQKCNTFVGSPYWMAPEVMSTLR